MDVSYNPRKEIDTINEKLTYLDIGSILSSIASVVGSFTLFFVLGNTSLLLGSFLALIILVLGIVMLIRFSGIRQRLIIKSKVAFAEVINREAFTRTLQLEKYIIILSDTDGIHRINGYYFQNDRMVNIKINVEIIKSENDHLKLTYSELNRDVGSYKAGNYAGKLYIKK
ncbi:hypothetical protein [Paenibacillus taichungensis]